MKKRPNSYYVHIETDKLWQTKKKKDMPDSGNRKQPLADTFEYRCSWKYLCWSLFFNKVAGLQLYYKILQHRCFPVKYVTFLRTPFFTEQLRWLLLENLFRSSRERRLHITGEIYAVIWQKLLLLLVKDVSSCIWRI